MCNKKLLFYLSLHSVSGYLMLLLVSFMTKAGVLSTETYVYNGIITAVAIIISLIFTVLYNLNAKSEKLTKLDVALPLIIFIVIYILYPIPPLDFMGINGVNNSVFSAFFFLIAGQYLHNFACYINDRKERKTVKTMNEPTYYRYHHSGILITKNGIKFNADFFCYGGYSWGGIGLFVAVFNVFKPVIDLTSIFEMIKF